jgi:hypothetical protein
MAGSHSILDTFLEVLEASRLGLLHEQRPVEILEGMPTNASDRDTIVLRIPFHYGSRYKLEALAYLGWYRDLPLRRDPGLCKLHAVTVPR